jgi:hypothetical protein
MYLLSPTEHKPKEPAMAVTTTRRVQDIKIGDEVVSGHTAFVVHKIDDDDPMVRGLRDQAGVLWRQPGRWDEVTVYIDPKPGDPASILFYSDTRAAVIVRVTPKSIVVARVETGPSRLDMASDSGAYGVRPTLEDGILDRPIAGSEERFTWNPRTGSYRRGSIRLVLGHSVTRVDHRN